MLGVFDSGVGGYTALPTLQDALPYTDLLYLADRKNAPYGTKSDCELCRLVQADLTLLLSMGACRVLIACMTASVIYERFLEKDPRITSLLSPAARGAVQATKNGRVGLLATESTVASGALQEGIRRLDPAIEVFAHGAGALVRVVEEGHTEPHDPTAVAAVQKALAPLQGIDMDTLILGCTHFPHLQRSFAAALPGVTLLSVSEAGARAFLKENKHDLPRERGRLTYIERPKAEKSP